MRFRRAPATRAPQSWRRQTDGSAPPPINPAPENPAAVASDSAGTTAPEAPQAKASALAPPAIQPDTAPQPDAAPAARNEPAPTGDLIVKASKDSWVRVRDVKGRELWSGVLKAGRSIGLSGRAPLDLVIGNAPFVAISFRGEAQNLSNHSINGVARLTVGDVR